MTLDAPRARYGLLGLAAYLVLAVASFYPQSFAPATTIAYVGDSLEAVWVLAWNSYQLVHDPARIFEANIFHPAASALTYTDHRLGTSLLVAPVIWITSNPVLAYNVSLLLGVLLAAIGGQRLGLALGLGPIGAWAAGALYGFHTYQINEGPRIHILYHGFIPLALEQLLRFLRTGERRHAFLLAGLMLAQGLCSSYHVLYGAFLLSLILVGVSILRPRLALARVPGLVLPAACALILFSPILLPYLRSAEVHRFQHELPQGVDLLHYVSTTPTNLLYGAVGGPVRLQQNAPHFVGFVSLALATGALVSWCSKRQREETLHRAVVPPSVWVPAALLLALLFVALSLGREVVVFGHDLGPGPYRLLYHWVPGFQQVRIPERLSLLAMLFIALLAGRAITLLERGRFRPAAFSLALLVPAEHLSPLPLTEKIPVGEQVPAVYRWLEKQPARAVAELPIGGESLIRKETLEMYFSSYHRKPIIHGYESYPPLLTTFLRQMAAEFPSELSFDAFQRVGVDTLVVHRGRAEGAALESELPQWVEAGRLEFLARFTGPSAHVYRGTADEVYRIVQGPPAPAAPFPSGRPYRDPRWTLRASRGDAELAMDGDLDTSWDMSRPLMGDEIFEVNFREPIEVRGVVLRLSRLSIFPPRFRIMGRTAKGQRVALAQFDVAHEAQLVDALLGSPGEAALGFDVGNAVVQSLTLRIGREGTRFDRSPIPGWSIPELEIRVPGETRVSARDR
jgi:hypothetical protein